MYQRHLAVKQRTLKICAAVSSFSGENSFLCAAICFFFTDTFYLNPLVIVFILHSRFLHSSQRNRHSLTVATDKFHFIILSFCLFYLFIFIINSVWKKPPPPFISTLQTLWAPNENFVKLCQTQNELTSRGEGTAASFKIICHFLLLWNQQPQQRQTWLATVCLRWID